jgi:hypothetical protein
LLIDEADSFLRDNEELRGVLNSGHRRGGAVLRNVGDDHEPRSFSTYAACAIALIGQLPGTLADRSVTVDLVRRKADEAVEAFRFDRVEHLAVLARKLARWAADKSETIAGVEPEMPAGLYNRAADNWRGLLAIATVAGGDWLSRGHRAALQGADLDVDEASRLELLLGDIRDIFDEVGKEEITSAHLIDRLVEIVPRPWAEYGRSGKPLTQNKLARLLRPLSIPPERIRVIDDREGEIQVRGYRRARFDEAFERFLGDSKCHSVPNADEVATSRDSQSVTTENGVTLRKSQKSNNDGLCDTVTLGKGGLGEWARASDGNGQVGLSQRTISELAEGYTERAYANAQENGGDTRTADLDAALRRRLAEMVLPEFIEVEFERVMTEVFRV